MRVEVTEKRFVKMNIRVRDRNATTRVCGFTVQDTVERETLPFLVLQKKETTGTTGNSHRVVHTWSHAASFPLSHHARTSGLVSGLVGRRRRARGRVAKQDVGSFLRDREDGRPELPAWHRGLGLGLGARL